MVICDECKQQTFETGGHVGDCKKNPIRAGVGFGCDEDYAGYMTDADWQDLLNPNEGCK